MVELDLPVEQLRRTFARLRERATEEERAAERGGDFAREIVETFAPYERSLIVIETCDQVLAGLAVTRPRPSTSATTHSLGTAHDLAGRNCQPRDWTGRLTRGRIERGRPSCFSPGVPPSLLLSLMARARLVEKRDQTESGGPEDSLVESVVLAYVVTKRSESVTILELAQRFSAEFDQGASESAVERAVLELSAGPTLDKDDNHISRTVMKLDAEGWDEIVARLKETLDDVLAIKERAERRVVTADENVIHAKVSILHRKSRATVGTRW